VVKTRRLAVVLFAAGLLTAGTSSAQFVRLSRCQTAFPCSIPFGLQYNPDPLIAGPYAQVPNTAVSARVEIAAPFKFEVDRPLDQKTIDEAVRKTLEIGERNAKPAKATPGAVLPASPAPPAAGPMSPPRNPPPKS